MIRPPPPTGGLNTLSNMMMLLVATHHQTSGPRHCAGYTLKKKKINSIIKKQTKRNYNSYEVHIKKSAFHFFLNQRVSRNSIRKYIQISVCLIIYLSEIHNVQILIVFIKVFLKEYNLLPSFFHYSRSQASFVSTINLSHNFGWLPTMFFLSAIRFHCCISYFCYFSYPLPRTLFPTLSFSYSS